MKYILVAANNPEACDAIRNIFGGEYQDAFGNYPWPGNIRELENLMERAYILELSSLLTPVSFPEDLFRPEWGIQGISVDCSQTLEEARNRAVEDVERRYLKTSSPRTGEESMVVQRLPASVPVSCIIS
jgi:DNA-binding NtrC family response regulator